jgi:Leucine-rich repeat (LRR) protein
MTDLTRLWLDANNITSIPSEIGLLSNLEDLWLDSNQITSIPTEISLLANLTRFSLDTNNISTIPSEIGLMTGLLELNLLNNQIAYDNIPQEVKELCSSDDLDRCKWAFNETTQNSTNSQYY